MSAREPQPREPAGSADAAGNPHPEISERVLQYFLQHGEAMDSVDGIARFWVREDRGAVASCLAALHARGLLEKRLIAGTEFFSLRKGARDPGAAPAGPATPGPAAAVSTRGRVLVVDDDSAVRKFMVEALSEAGHSVAAAADGEGALEMCRTGQFDLLVTDLMMPGMSGLQLLQEVRRTSRSTEVIVITAHASLDAAIEALRLGAYDFISKPFDNVDALQRVVARSLEKRRLSAENRFLVEHLQERNLELKETVSRLAAVNEIGRAATGLLDNDELCETLVRLVAQHLKARRVSVLLSEPDSDTMTLVASIGIFGQEALKRRVRVGEGIAGRVAAAQTPLLVADIEKSDLRNLRTGGRYKTSSFMVTPLPVSYPIRFQRRRIGVINVSDKQSGEAFTEQDLEFLSTLASQMAVAIENARLVRDMEGGYLGLLAALIRAAEDTRPESRGHSQRVAGVAAAVGRELGLADPRIEALVQAAAMHEIGRVAERGNGDGGGEAEDAARNWTPAAAMAAERLLAPIESLREAREIILHSADRFDATAALPFAGGRPGTPLESRILGASEAFARLAPGNGKEPEQVRAALAALREQAGRAHDPEVVAALERLVRAGGM